jgi:hypothetical protein
MNHAALIASAVPPQFGVRVVIIRKPEMRGTQFAYGCAHAAKIERGCYVRSLKPESVYWPGTHYERMRATLRSIVP